MAIHTLQRDSGPANPAHKVDIVKLLESTKLNGFHPLRGISENSSVIMQMAAIASAVSNSLDGGSMPDEITQTCMEAINTLAGLATFVEEHKA